MSINYRELLKKYMGHILEEEGITFVPMKNPPWPYDGRSALITAKEIDVLVEIAKEICDE